MQEASQDIRCLICMGPMEGACWKDDRIKRCKKCESYTDMSVVSEEDQSDGGESKVEPVDEV